ncbi:MAG: hypothetical protein A2W93_01555 [Bacteroidetes bacterium GWF2_43_63]|nr:MAG: hypothetical protein A2W94_10515 [Bacteroidetes bacterium GWE2_42_42]OFY55754.1 MAG: hypothetical protein A2W93_01555 [Bacteroidetes bacterium GWF2_43_63]HBG71331.1 hypothetical protein [Bacteroidales bacterium]HCB60449.1 hypothetical protein [Bacteroidales bacterium]HCY22594.1 hypothetical protein [Bacteroidales bacterium]
MRRMRNLIWPVLFSVTTISVLCFVVKPEILTGTNITTKEIAGKGLYPATTYASAKMVTTGSFMHPVAFKALSHRSLEISSDLKIALRFYVSDKKLMGKHFEKKHCHQSVKSSAGFFQGAYEQAL